MTIFCIKNCSKLFFLAFVILLTGTACIDNTDCCGPGYDVPMTYDFENVSYTGQLHRLAMMGEWKSYMANSQSGSVLDADRMKAMFANEDGAGFSEDYSKQIRSKTFEAVQPDFDALIDELADASTSITEGSEGVSGLISSTDDAKTYLIGEDGLDHAQIIEKGLMGACFYYQGTSVYLGDGKMNVDNEIVEPGEGTAMEHHWDESFGYFGVPRDFPVNLDGIVFWGDYSNKRNAIIRSYTMMEAFLIGRDAITRKDIRERDRAITNVRTIWEEIGAASALHYINSGIANFDDMALRGHGLSEAIGFIYGLQFNTEKNVTNAEVAELLTLIAGAADFSNMNLYSTTLADLQLAKDKLAAYYNWEENKDEF